MRAKQRLSLHSQRNGIGGSIRSSRALAAMLSFASRKTSSVSKLSTSAVDYEHLRGPFLVQPTQNVIRESRSLREWTLCPHETNAWQGTKHSSERSTSAWPRSPRTSSRSRLAENRSTSLASADVLPVRS